MNLLPQYILILLGGFFLYYGSTSGALLASLLGAFLWLAAGIGFGEEMKNKP